MLFKQDNDYLKIIKFIDISLRTIRFLEIIHKIMKLILIENKERKIDIMIICLFTIYIIRV
jgi:hypothetical protein